MSAAHSALEPSLANQLVAFSVSDSPDLGRLGLLDRSVGQTVAALATELVRQGARVAYGGNLDQDGFTYQFYPTIAQAYATAARRSVQPPFVHYLAAYLAQDAQELAAHLKAVGGITEVRLVDRDRAVTTIVTHGNEVICNPPNGETRRLTDLGMLAAFVADTPRRSGGRDMDLDAMREAMEGS